MPSCLKEFSQNEWEHGEGWLNAWLEEMKDAGVLD